MENEIKFLKEVIAAQGWQLVCYRLGEQPPEWVFDKLGRAKKIYGNLQKITSDPVVQMNSQKDFDYKE